MKEAENKQNTIEEYLSILEESEVKLEYSDGEIIAMSGGSPNHSKIAVNISSLLNFSLEDKNCTVFNSDGQIAIKNTNSYVFPDVSVVCGPEEMDEQNPNSIVNPILVIEVLSPSTEHYDKVDKFKKYMSIPSLKEYIMVSSTKVEVESYFRESKNHWHYTILNDVNENMDINSLGIKLALERIYKKVVF